MIHCLLLGMLLFLDYAVVDITNTTIMIIMVVDIKEIRVIAIEMIPLFLKTPLLVFPFLCSFLLKHLQFLF